MTGSLSITGALTVGSTATVKAGTFTPASTDKSWYWYLDGKPVFGAQGETITITEAMKGKRLEARLTAYEWSFGDNQYYNRVSVVVPNTFTAPAPTISGTKAVGYTLTANVGTWSPAATTYTYQWFRSGAAISGATARTYKLTSTDAGRTITVRVTGAKTGYVTKAVTSAATSAVLKVFSSAPAPTISGTRKVGYTLTANLGTWSPTPTGTTYKWYRSGVLISGATARSYKLTSLDRGKTIKVVVTRSLAGYLTTARTSAATASVV